MELRSNEKEVSSLLDLYQGFYNASVTSVYLDQSESPSLLLLQKYPILIIKNYIPFWEDILLQIKSDDDAANGSNENVTTTSSNETNSSSTKETKSMSITAALELIYSFQERMNKLNPKIDRYLKRMQETDPVTQAPRYGEKTMKRVKSLITLYNGLSLALEIIVANETNLIANPKNSNIHTHTPLVMLALLETLSKEEKEYIQKQTKLKEQTQKAKEEELRTQQTSQEMRLQEEEEAKRQFKLEQEQELARKANAARLAKEQQLEREKQARKDALLEDQRFMNSIVKGEDGVTIQLQKLQELQRQNQNKEYRIAIESLYTIFKQIVSQPDNEVIRKIKRDHERFHNDIGKYDGGSELLVAVGFRLVRIQTEERDDTPVFLLKEPNIETDMDGWSEWFDMLKATLKLLEHAKLDL